MRFGLLLAAVKLGIGLLANLGVQLALLDLCLLRGQIDHLFLLGDLGVCFGLLDLTGTQVGLNHTGGLCIGSSLVGLGLQLGLCQFQLIVALGNGSLGFDLLFIGGHGGGSLGAGYIALSLGLGNRGTLFHKLLLLHTDGFDDTMVMPHRIHSVLDILYIEGHNLQTHLGKVGAGVFDHADCHLLAVGQDLVDRHLTDDLTQVALQHIIDLFIDMCLVHSEEVRDRRLLAGVDVLFDVIIPGCANFIIRDGRVFAVDLHSDYAVQPEGNALLGFDARFRRLDINFQKAHVQPVGALHNGQDKNAAPAYDLGAGQPETGHNDRLGRRGFLIAEKAEYDERRCHGCSNDDSHRFVPPSERRPLNRGRGNIRISRLSC